MSYASELVSGFATGTGGAPTVGIIKADAQVSGGVPGAHVPVTLLQVW